MDVIVDRSFAVRVADADDLKRFKVVIAGRPQDLATIRAAIAQVADLESDRHAWIGLDWIRSRCAERPADWKGRFEEMIAFARTNGWVRESPPAIRGHVEWLEA